MTRLVVDEKTLVCIMDSFLVTILLSVLLSVTCISSLHSRNATYCVSENNCSEHFILCQECHPLMWYSTPTHMHAIPNNTEIVFLHGNHFLNTRVEFSNKHNLQLVAPKVVENINGKPSPKSVIKCQQKFSGFIFQFSTGIDIQGLAFTDCGLHFHGFLTAIYFFESSNVTISSSVVSRGLGYNLIIDSFCSGSFEIVNSVFANSKSVCKDSNKNSGNFRIWLNICPQDNLHSTWIVVKHSWFWYDHSASNTSEFNGKGIQFTIRQPMVTISLEDIIVNNSEALYGGNIQIDMLSSYANLSQVNFLNCQILNGYSNEGGGVYVTFENGIHDGKTALISFNNTLFKSNRANRSGGALYVSLKGSEADSTKADSTSVLSFFNCTALSNLALDGGAFYITQHVVLAPFFHSHLSVSLEECIFKENKLVIDSYQLNGDGIVRFYSIKNAQIKNSNFSSNNGTALLLIESTVMFEQFAFFYNNWAPYGAAIRFCDVSQLFLVNGSNITFENNWAHVAGGAIYAGGHCLETAPQCFYQPIINTTVDRLTHLTALRFINNTARLAGDAIYGGSVDNCYTYYKFSNNSRNLYDKIFKEIFFISPNTSFSVTSDPYGVCFCNASRASILPDCSKERIHKYKTMYPGEEFTISVVAVGQQNGIVPSWVKLWHDSSDNVTMARYQNPPLRKCQSMSIAVFSRPNSEVYFTVAIKESNQVKQKSNYYRLHEPKISVHLKNCPWIFQFNEKTNSCDCNEVITTTSNSVSCDITSQSIHKGSDVWIGCSPGNNDSVSPCNKVEVSSRCLQSHCRDSSHLHFKWFNLSDQCVDERDGRLCGRCKSNYSLSLGPMTCVHSEENCSIYVTVLLIVVFILAGVLLVCFLTVFNFTVAEGTINGLLFYANCVHAKQDSFFLNDFRSSKMSFFRVFIAWLNLDLGFQVCFYSGMTAYQKAWLEFGFVLYLFLLGGVIVCLSRRSIRFTRLVGRNVVPVLATIALIVYPKIIRNCIMVWHCRTDFKSTDNLSISMWYSDETLSCFTAKHLPLSIFSILLFAAALLYTLCLFFIQCLQRGTGCFALKWINKLKPFFDASSGPCRDNYRFWPGLLLFARLALYVSVRTVISKYNLHWIIGISVLVSFFAFISPKGVYRKWQLNLLELWFFFNLILVSTITIIFTQQIVASISIGLAAATFLLILVYHTYKRVRGTRWWKRLLAVCRKKLGRVSADHEHNRALFEVADEREPLMKPNLSTGSN